jgi:hypothetical protein
VAELICFLLGGVAGSFIGTSATIAFLKALLRSERAMDLVLAPWRRKRSVLADIRRWGW